MFFVVLSSFIFIYPNPNFDILIDPIVNANIPIIKIYADETTINKPCGYIIFNVRFAY